MLTLFGYVAKNICWKQVKKNGWVRKTIAMKKSITELSLYINTVTENTSLEFIANNKFFSHEYYKLLAFYGFQLVFKIILD